MLSAKLFNQFGNAAQLVLLAVGFKSLAQTVGRFLSFDLEQDLIQQSKLTAIHVLDFVVQHRLQLFRRD